MPRRLSPVFKVSRVTSSPSDMKDTALLSCAEFYHELTYYVWKDKSETLKNKYERLTRRVKTQTVEVDDDFAEKIKDLGPGGMYDATKLLLTHVYTEEEIINNTVSGKRTKSLTLNRK